ncbi:MAG: hypothetical protein RI531_09140 [Haloferacaceae archaeon]|nr:hypothetical protein [Haloferacaceae archaeon]
MFRRLVEPELVITSVELSGDVLELPNGKESWLMHYLRHPGVVHGVECLLAPRCIREADIREVIQRRLQLLGDRLVPHLLEVIRELVPADLLVQSEDCNLHLSVCGLGLAAVVAQLVELDERL